MRGLSALAGRPRSLGKALLVVWPAVLLAIVGARIMGGRPKMDEEQLSRFATFFAVSLASADTFRVGVSGSAAAVFVDPRCHVCTENPDRVVSALQLYPRERYMVIPLSHREDIAELMIRLGYPREMIFLPDSAALSRLKLQFVPVFLDFGGVASLRWNGLPSSMKLIWLEIAEALKPSP